MVGAINTGFKNKAVNEKDFKEIKQQIETNHAEAIDRHKEIMAILIQLASKK